MISLISVYMATMTILTWSIRLSLESFLRRSISCGRGNKSLNAESIKCIKFLLIDNDFFLFQFSKENRKRRKMQRKWRKNRKYKKWKRTVNRKRTERTTTTTKKTTLSKWTNPTPKITQQQTLPPTHMSSRRHNLNLWSSPDDVTMTSLWRHKGWPNGVIPCSVTWYTGSYRRRWCVKCMIL